MKVESLPPTQTTAAEHITMQIIVIKFVTTQITSEWT